VVAGQIEQAMLKGDNFNEGPAWTKMNGAGALPEHHRVLHGCLTDPAHFKYSHPKQTIQRIKRLRKIVGPRTYCHHGRVDPACPQCPEGVRNRAIALRVCWEEEK
jgi:hypothetical protein